MTHFRFLLAAFPTALVVAACGIDAETDAFSPAEEKSGGGGRGGSGHSVAGGSTAAGAPAEGGSPSSEKGGGATKGGSNAAGGKGGTGGKIGGAGALGGGAPSAGGAGSSQAGNGAQAPSGGTAGTPGVAGAAGVSGKGAAAGSGGAAGNKAGAAGTGGDAGAGGVRTTGGAAGSGGNPGNGGGAGGLAGSGGDSGSGGLSGSGGTPAGGRSGASGGPTAGAGGASGANAAGQAGSAGSGVGPLCGNGAVDVGEDCDGTAGVPDVKGLMCGADCLLPCPAAGSAVLAFRDTTPAGTTCFFVLDLAPVDPNPLGSQAEEVCAFFGAQAAVLDDLAQRKRLDAAIELSTSVWVGAYQDMPVLGKGNANTGWKWHDGETTRTGIAPASWEDGQPNDNSSTTFTEDGEQNCARAFEPGFGLRDESCVGDRRPVLCERSPRAQ